MRKKGVNSGGLSEIRRENKGLVCWCKKSYAKCRQNSVTTLFFRMCMRRLSDWSRQVNIYLLQRVSTMYLHLGNPIPLLRSFYFYFYGPLCFHPPPLDLADCGHLQLCAISAFRQPLLILSLQNYPDWKSQRAQPIWNWRRAGRAYPQPCTISASRQLGPPDSVSAKLAWLEIATRTGNFELKMCRYTSRSLIWDCHYSLCASLSKVGWDLSFQLHDKP